MARLWGAGLSLAQERPRLTSAPGSQLSLRHSPAIAPIVATAAAIGLDWLFIGRKSFWEDEGSSWAFAHGSVSDLTHAILHIDPNMTLYYGLLHFWLRIGLSEAAIRSLSAVFAASTVPVVYLLGIRLFGKTAGAVAAITFAVNAFVVEYAQEARSYALVTFLVTVSSYFFVCDLQRPSRWTRAAYVTATVLAMYAHFFAAWVLFVQLLTLVCIRPLTRLVREWFGTLVVIGVGYLPAAAQIVRFGHANIAWIPQPTTRTLVHVSARLSGGHWAMLLILLCAAAVLARRAQTQPGRGWQTGFALTWLFVPVLLSFLLSFVETMFYPAYLIITVPAVALVMGGGMAEVAKLNLAGRAIAAAALSAVLVLSGFQLHHWYTNAIKEDWRGATRYVLEHERAGDRVAFYVPHGANPFNYYAQLSGRPAPRPIDLARTPRGAYRVWLVRLHVPVNDSVLIQFGRRLAAAGYSRLGSRVFSPRRAQLGITLYARPR